jgi:hypothetical protein
MKRGYFRWIINITKDADKKGVKKRVGQPLLVTMPKHYLTDA